MSSQEKLLDRLCSRPKDFTWDEASSLLKGLGFEERTGRGSRVKFFHPEKDLLCCLHRPHPRNELKRYQINDILDVLKDGGYLS